MLKNVQTYFKNLAVFTLHDFNRKFDRFSTLWKKELKVSKIFSGQTTESLKNIKSKMYKILLEIGLHLPTAVINGNFIDTQRALLLNFEVYFSPNKNLNS